MAICNQAVFRYEGDRGYLYGVIVVGTILGVYLIFRMCKLCYGAFSYSNFHIHETYKFYALAIIALSFTIFFHKAQLEYLNEIKPNDPANREQGPQNADNWAIQGYQILIEIFGIISIYFTRLLYALNGLTWLLITLGCDYSPESELTLSHITGFPQSSNTKALRKKMQIVKFITFYMVFPLLVLLAIIGTLQQNEDWCRVAESTLILSSVITIMMFGAGAGLFLYRRRGDDEVSTKTKVTLGYLLLAVTVRETYLLVTQITQTPIFNLELVLIIYTLLCILAPFLAMSILSERQLQREKCAILKSTEIMLFKSIAN